MCLLLWYRLVVRVLLMNSLLCPMLARLNSLITRLVLRLARLRMMVGRVVSVWLIGLMLLRLRVVLLVALAL